MVAEGFNLSQKIFLLDDAFPTSYRPETKIVCQCYAFEKLVHQTTKNGVHKTNRFSSSKVRVLHILYVKKALKPHCNNHLLENVIGHYIPSHIYAATIIALFHSLIEIFYYGGICYIIRSLRYLCTFLYFISTLSSC